MEPTVDGFSQKETARLERWWGPGSSEAEDAFSRSWSNEVVWANPPFSLLHKVLVKVVDDKAHAIVVMPEWRTHSFFRLAKDLEVCSIRFDRWEGIFEENGSPLRKMSWDAQAIYVCGGRADCPIHGPKCESKFIMGDARVGGFSPIPIEGGGSMRSK